jgi:hypothetical protein
MKRNRTALTDKVQAEIIDKARAKRSRRAVKKGKQPGPPAAKDLVAQPATLAKSVKQVTQKAVAMVEGLVETAAEKIKGVMDSPPLPPAPADKGQKPRARTADE